MKIGLTVRQKVFIVIAFFVLAVIGFLVKLPTAFRHIDKELHATFYFFAAALLNVLFAGTKLVRHVLVFIALYLFGTAIEYAQDYSNKIFHNHIHGRFDPIDIQWNLKGLLLFSLLWLLCTLAILAYKKSTVQKSGYKAEPLQAV